MLNKKPKEQEVSEGKMYEVIIAYVVELQKNDEKGLPIVDSKILYSGYINHFLNYEESKEIETKINGPLIATTVMEMPFETLEYCLYAMMNILRSDVINYSVQNEEELIKNNEPLKVTQVTREELIPGISQLQNTVKS